jgi:hypothetical protein
MKTTKGRAMMTNQPIQTASTQRTKRDKYPARSARIITAGIALASTLGLSSAYTIAAQAKVTEGLLPNNATVDPAQQVVAQAPAVNAPTQPAPAATATAPATAATPAAAPIATAPPANQAPVVVNIAPPAPQAQWTPPATTGSK